MSVEDNSNRHFKSAAYLKTQNESSALTQNLDLSPVFDLAFFFRIYKESLTAMVPFLLLSASSVLISEIVTIFNIEVGVLTPKSSQLLSTSINQCFSIIILLSLAYHIAKRLNTHLFFSVSQVMLCYITIQMLGNINEPFSHIFTSQLSLLVMVLPFICVMLQNKLKKYTNLYAHSSYDKNLNEIFGYLPSFILTYGVVTLLYVLFSAINVKFSTVLLHGTWALSDDTLFAIRTASNSVLWFCGLHGTYTFDVMFGNEFLKHTLFANLSYRQFYDLFVVYGGAGATTSLIVAILLSKNNKSDKHIAKLASPFAIFNINEILIFGLPIIFNRYLFIPFVAVPLINLGIAYGFFSLFPIEFSLQSAPWITPVFFNAYLATGGNFYAVGLQLVLVALGALIYYPFVRKFAAVQSLSAQTRLLAKKLNIADENDLFDSIGATEGILAYQAQFKIIQANHELENIIKLLHSNSLHTYYQPKVDIITNHCNSFEALLRLELADGKIIDPYFLHHIEDSGLAPILDLWVCRRVAQHIRQWQNASFNPSISINLHPDTLNNKTVVKNICGVLAGLDIDFEIIERSLLHGDNVQDNIKLLRDGGFTLSIDDFGVGYSSLSNLVNASYRHLKIDISLIKLITTKQGYEVNQSIFNLCSQMGVVAVAEGVENEDQLSLVRKIGIQYVQGYYFSAAIEFAQVTEFVESLKETLHPTHLHVLEAVRA